MYILSCSMKICKCKTEKKKSKRLVIRLFDQKQLLKISFQGKVIVKKPTCFLTTVFNYTYISKKCLYCI